MGTQLVLIDFLIPLGNHDDDNYQHNQEEYKQINERLMKGLGNLFHIRKSNTLRNDEYLYMMIRTFREDWTYVAKYIHKNPIPFPNDPIYMLPFVREKGSLIQFASHSLRDDRDFVLASVKLHQSAFPFVSERLRLDEEVIKMAANIHSNTPVNRRTTLNDLLFKCDFSNRPKTQLGLISLFKNPSRVFNSFIPFHRLPIGVFSFSMREELLKNREILLEAVKREGKVLYYLRKKQPEKMIVAAALHSLPITEKAVMKYFQKEWINDPEFLLECGRIEMLKDSNLSIDRDFLSSWIVKYGMQLQMFKFCDGFEFEFWRKLLDAKAISPAEIPTRYFEKLSIDTLKQILSVDGCLLQFMPNNFKNDIELVSQIVDKFPQALEFASEEIRNNIDVVNIAIHSTVYGAVTAIRFASETIRSSEQAADFILSNISNRNCFQYLGHEIRSNKANYRLIFHRDLNIKRSPESIRNDIELCRELIKEGELLYPLFSEAVKLNFDIAHSCISRIFYKLPYKSQRRILEVFPEPLRDNEEFIEMISNNNITFFRYATPRVRSNAKFVKTLLRKHCRTSSLIYDFSCIDNKEDQLEIYKIISEIAATEHIVREPLYFAGPLLLMDKDFVVKELTRLNIDMEAARSYPIVSLVHFGSLPNSVARTYPPAFTQQWLQVHEDDCSMATQLIRKTSNSETLDFTKFPEKLKKNSEFILGICDLVPLIEYLPSEQITEEIMIKSNEWYPIILRYAPDHLKDNGTMVFALLTSEEKLVNLKLISTRLQNDREFFQKVLDRYPRALEYASNELKNDLDLIINTRGQPIYEMYKFASPQVLARMRISLDFMSTQLCEYQQVQDKYLFY